MQIRRKAGTSAHSADAAGPVILPRFRKSIAVTNKAEEGRFDPVTVADQASEAAMRQLIEAHYPDHGIYGEEFPDKPANGPYAWVLDPIDGTRGFISGLHRAVRADEAGPFLALLDRTGVTWALVRAGSAEARHLDRAGWTRIHLDPVASVYRRPALPSGIATP